MLAITNYSAIVRPLQWLVVVIVWLFFLRVVRAVWVEVRPAGPRQEGADRRRQEREASRTQRRRRRQLHLEAIEPAEQRGVAYDFDEEATIGRAQGCEISTAYDVYSSSHHARLFRHSDKLWVEDLGSTNGTFVNSEHVARPTRLGKGDLVQVGGTVFEVVK